jgi:hypothetical protein
MEHEAILKWAAGSAQALPTRVEFDEETLLDLVDAHNLSGRFLRSLANRTPPWVTHGLQDALREMHSKTTARIIENASAFREFSARLPPSARVVIIKGMSTYVLSRQAHTMRCGDLDVFSNDSAALSKALKKLGYRQTRGPFLYELGEYTRGAVEIDLHEYFPVYSYPSSLSSADLRPEHHPAAWQQSYQLQQHEISYDDLSVGAIRSAARETEGVTVPDPNMLALILCSHAFLNYTNVWSISHRDNAYVRLGEMADLFDLAAHPSFSRARFLQLVGRFGANDAVEWAACVAASLFGRNPLPVHVAVRLGDALPDARFPRCLWWSFWLDLRSGTDELLRRQWLDMRSLVTQLGGNTLRAVGGRTGRHSTVGAQGTMPLSRFITQAADETPIPFDLEVSRSERGLRLELEVLTRPKGDANRIRVDYGHTASEWIHSLGDTRPSVVGAPATVSFEERDDGYGLAWEFPWELLGESVSSEREISLLVGVAGHSQRDGLTASTLVPLSVRFDS